MEEEVHFGNGRIDNVLLLAKDTPAAEVIVVHMMDGLDEHASRSTSGVIYGLTRLRIKDSYQQRDNRTRGIEFTCLRFTVISESLQEDFIGITHQVGRVVFVPQAPGRKMLYKVTNLAIGEILLIGPFLSRECAENSV